MVNPGVNSRDRKLLPALIILEAISDVDASAESSTSKDESTSSGPSLQEQAKIATADTVTQEQTEILITSVVASRIPYVISALSDEWRPTICVQGSSEIPSIAEKPSRVQVFMPHGCKVSVLRLLLGRLALDADVAVVEQGLTASWRPCQLTDALQLVQVASMLQVESIMPELVNLVREAVAAAEDVEELEAICERLELPQAVREVATAAARFAPPHPEGLPNEDQVRGMIASALLTADGKVWRVVQKVIDRREVWPSLAKENAAVLLAFATGIHGSIRATPHIGFFWGSRDFLYLVCRYVRNRPEHFGPMVSAMFDSVYSMDPELPAEVIDAVFKELLIHDGLTFGQCEHVIAKLVQRGEQMEYLFHEWSGVFSTLPPNARYALAKGLLPSIGRCPHTVLDFVLKELDSTPVPSGASAARKHLLGTLQHFLGHHRAATSIGGLLVAFMAACIGVALQN